MMVGSIQRIKQTNEIGIVIASPRKKVWKSSEAILKASIATQKVVRRWCMSQQSSEKGRERIVAVWSQWPENQNWWCL